MLLGWELFVFTDAGFGTLVQNQSVESHVVLLGGVIERGGIIKCHGLMLGRRCAKIRRVCRSTLAAEARGAVTAVDVALWFHVILTEIFTHDFYYKRLTPPTEFPPINPFRESPSDDDAKRETSLNKIRPVLLSAHSANPMMAEEKESFHTTCKCCGISMKLDTITMHDLSPVEGGIYDLRATDQPEILLHPMVITDCCSLYGAILRLQPKTTERCARITLAFLRDALNLAAFSFVDATVNLGDVGTKHAGSLGILDHFLKTCRFTLSLSSRKGRK